MLFATCNYDVGRDARIRTEETFKSRMIVEENIYRRDSLQVLANLKGYLQRHEQSFYNKSYFDSTELLLDTILYSPDIKRLVVFVLARNPTSRQFQPNTEYAWYYDGFCYLGIRENDDIRLNWFRRFNLINYYDEQEAKNDLKEYYFTRLASAKDTDGSLIYKFNVDDSRFWDGPVWKVMD
ncbi:hypothetical protein C5745_19730 [Sphingobacterium haloxyli]|uniref:Uncharacterized protein n=2 Tax=Sphingobacterium haloxyli TaxID=2100533 RepID=A0A2S9IUA2_9SPHI|nr:hypothetical protein C5745_19730 [Sphingobacterium haloxyli]